MTNAPAPSPSMQIPTSGMESLSIDGPSSYSSNGTTESPTFESQIKLPNGVNDNQNNHEDEDEENKLWERKRRYSASLHNYTKSKCQTELDQFHAANPGLSSPKKESE